MSSITLFAALFLLLFGGLGLTLIISAARQLSKADEARKWPTTPGKVITLDAEEHVYRHRRKHGGTRTRRRYEPKIEYEYVVDGLHYLGNRVGFGNYQLKLNAAKALLARYATGPVVVHYHPHDPNQAVLDTQATGTAAGLVMGFIFILIGFIVAASSLLAGRG